VEKKRKTKNWEVSANTPGNPWTEVSPEEEKEGSGGKNLQWKSEGVMDDENGESMEPMEDVSNQWLMPLQ